MESCKSMVSGVEEILTDSKRWELIQILGGLSCKNCGITDKRILEIDHIYGNGKTMPIVKAEVIDTYLNNPELAKHQLQVLCRNCHKIKSLKNGELGRKPKSKKIEQFDREVIVYPTKDGKPNEHGTMMGDIDEITIIDSINGKPNRVIITTNTSFRGKKYKEFL